MTTTTVSSSHSRSQVPTRRLVLAKSAGFCFGVRRAVDITLKERERNSGRMTMLGPIVHNDQVTERLKAQRIGTQNVLEQISSGTIVISAHGAAPELGEAARAKGLNVLDTTCPFVTKVHRSARQLNELGYQILLVGDMGHTEVLGVVKAIEALGGAITVVSSPEEIVGLALGRKVGIISQTTQYSATFADVVAAVCRKVQDVRAINTVCGATEELQEAAIRMASQVDVAIVVGGKQSANSRRLRELCESAGIPAYQVETADEIEEAWLEGTQAVGLTAGASTPDWVIEQVARRLNNGSLPADWRVSHPD